MASGQMRWSLNTEANDDVTLDFHARPDFQVRREIIKLPKPGRGTRQVLTVSHKEILLALLQHGRTTELTGEACSVKALSDHIAVRQNIVAWAEQLNWRWPDGGAATWNKKLWSRGTPKPGIALHVAVNDAFMHPEKYSIGCYTATKLVVLQGVLDYYRRVKPDTRRSALLEARLLDDGDPLVDLEPSIMWRFEADFDPAAVTHPGKLLNLHAYVSKGNFVPGDWVYFVNTDFVSGKKTGYEGSNAIYMGMNSFDDYYNDHKHRYSYAEKLNEVYQWRNGVFNRERDREKNERLSLADQARLTEKPADGGIQLDFRVAPRFF